MNIIHYREWLVTAWHLGCRCIGEKYSGTECLTSVDGAYLDAGIRY